MRKWWILFCIPVVLVERVGLGANLSLAWDRSAATNVAAYRIYYSTTPRGFSNYTQVPGFSARAVVAGLTGNTKYYFAATAIDINGIESAFSETMEFLATDRAGPVAPNLVASTVEDTSVNINLAVPDRQAANITYSIHSPPANGTLGGAAPNLVYLPRTNFFGTDQFIYTVSDGIVSTSATVTINVAPANDPPTLDPVSGLVLAQNAGAQKVKLTGITSGPGDQPQTLFVTAVSNRPQLIPNPTVNYSSPNSTAILCLTPNTNAIGWSVITVTVRDDGASNNVTAQTFWVLINNPPTVDAIPDIVIPQDSAAQIIPLTGISSGAPNEAQTIYISALSNNPNLVPTPTVNYVSPSATGNITLKLVPKMYGTAKITVIVQDGQYANDTSIRIFLVKVKPPIDLPTMNGISSVSVDSNLGACTVALSAISAGVANDPALLRITALSSNPALVPHPKVTYVSPNTTGFLTLIPALGRAGLATIAVIVDNGQPTNNVIQRSFVVSVTSPPQISNLSAGPLDARTIMINWTTDKTSTCTLAYGNTADVDRVGPTTFGNNHSMTISNLSPGTLYYLRVKATTATGTATVDMVANTEPLRVLGWQAEYGEFDDSVAVISAEDAENESYIVSKDTNALAEALQIYIAGSVNYRIWARLRHPSGGAFLRLSLDGGPESEVFAADSILTDGWHWALLTQASNASQPVSYSMNNGLHQLRVSGDAEIALDTFTFTNDPLWGPILPSTRPVLSVTQNGNDSATLAWLDPSGNALGAAIEYSTDGVDFTEWTRAYAPATSIDFAPAVGGAYFRMYSFSSVDQTGYSNIVFVQN